MQMAVDPCKSISLEAPLLVAGCMAHPASAAELPVPATGPLTGAQKRAKLAEARRQRELVAEGSKSARFVRSTRSTSAGSFSPSKTTASPRATGIPFVVPWLPTRIWTAKYASKSRKFLPSDPAARDTDMGDEPAATQLMMGSRSSRGRKECLIGGQAGR